MIENFLRKMGYSKTIYLSTETTKKRKLSCELSNKKIELKTQKSKYKRTIQKHIKFEARLQRERDTAINNYKIENKNRSELQIWSKKVRSTGVCDVCVSAFPIDQLQAHHIWSKSLHSSLAYRVENGVALCKCCHEEYHKKYQIHECNPISYHKFKEDYK